MKSEKKNLSTLSFCDGMVESCDELVGKLGMKASR